MSIAPRLCHSHIHLDKCYILDSCPLLDGSFQEALEMTGKSKSQFSEEDLLRRGRKLISDSVKFGVTSMRAHVEVDDIVELKCLSAGLILRKEFRNLCNVQIAVFAQEPTIGRQNAELLRSACSHPGVETVASAPYVEATEDLALQNIDLAIELALSHKLHLDFHLDYDLTTNAGRPPLIHAVVRKLHEAQWTVRNPGKRIAIGHATRLSFFTADQWRGLDAEIGNLPIAFIGLPQSDVYMMGRGPLGSRPRGTLNVVEMIRQCNIDAALSVNNVANAFTPQGNEDPLGLCPLGVALYQAATPEACRVLLESVSSRSKKAIGDEHSGLQITVGMPADLILLHENRTVQDAALNPSESRTTIKAGRVVACRRLYDSIVA
ncbi:Metallo-dependent hydrolase [Auricularia subglabra TFB-10046 SS5]|nr:Metallo-dependent hydrolase [Auricularia subglabra TFB-10046 SS5]